uniref:Uncharacterized protein n=1 Tax=Rousettus aegyptiacus TaxID=9407 RepID=A0A7J8GBM9_ROUAE|nr:hypothetical protein HJG63_011761 [Rousettus aegyptiacus]
MEAGPPSSLCSQVGAGTPSRQARAAPGGGHVAGAAGAAYGCPSAGGGPVARDFLCPPPSHRVGLTCATDRCPPRGLGTQGSAGPPAPMLLSGVTTPPHPAPRTPHCPILRHHPQGLRALAHRVPATRTRAQPHPRLSAGHFAVVINASGHRQTGSLQGGPVSSGSPQQRKQ